MARTKKPIAPLPADVTGGLPIAASENLDHGLGNKDEFAETLMKAAQEQGVTMAPKPAGDDAPDNTIAIPMHETLVNASLAKIASFYSTQDPARREALEIAERVLSDLIRELISPTAALYVPPDEFAQLHRDLLSYVEAFASDVAQRSSKHCKRPPIDEAALRNKLASDFRDPAFRHKHRKLFGHLEAAKTARPCPGALFHHIASSTATAS
jgi:hypothetical protein